VNTRGAMHSLIVHPVAVCMIFLAALVFGFVSYQRLAIELMPDISYPTITVRTVYDGAAPQEVETQISRPAESALATLDGLVSIESRSRAGVSDVVLGFDWGTDMSAAMQTIRENMQTTYVPAEAERPLILRYDPSLDPFLRLALSVDSASVTEGEQALLLLREIADEHVKRELEAIGGVAAVRVRGGLEREIRLHVREDWLAARRVTLDEVRQAVAAENINIAGGSILEGDTEYLVRTLNEYVSLDELSSLKVRRADGVLVPLTDVATLSETHREREVVSRLDGGEAVEFELFKEADANVVALSHDVMAALGSEDSGVRKKLPEGVQLAVVENQAEFIEQAVTNLRNTAVIGSFFAVFVLFLFLRDMRSTLVIGLAIPVSVICGFAPLYLLDVSLNLMSLGGLALGVGMLVDNAVVVLESIQRYREEGIDHVDAAAAGVNDVAMAVVASTLTTVAVFLPIAFVEGVAGELFGDLSLAVVSSLLASLMVALFLVPTLAAVQFDASSATIQTGVVGRLLRRRELGLSGVVGGIFKDVWSGPRDRFTASWRAGSGWKRVFTPYLFARLAVDLGIQAGLAAAAAVFVGFAGSIWLVAKVLWWPASIVAFFLAARFQDVYGVVARAYPPLLSGMLRHSGLVVFSGVALFLVALQGGSMLGSELIPEVHQGRFVMDLALPVGRPLSSTDVVASRVEAIALAHPEVQSVYAQVGADARADARADEGEHTARLRVTVKPSGNMAAVEERVMEDLRIAVAEFERVDVKLSRPSLFTYQTPVEVVIFGNDLDALARSGERVRSAVAKVDGLRDVRTSLVDGHPEVRITYDRTKLHRHGLNPSEVATRVRDKVQGVVATRIRRGDQRIDLRVQLDEGDREDLADLRSLNVNPNLYPEVPLIAVADFDEDVGPSEIRRVDQDRAVVVSANLVGFDLASAASGVELALADLSLDEDHVVELAGQFREMRRSLVSMQFALALAVFLVYVIMASTFEHLIHPFVILLSVPLALVGAVAGLVVTGTSLSVVTFIGMIVLAGVVVNNAIVLVDAVNKLRADGLPMDAALRQGGQMRLRPILITTATTVLGLMPLALGIGAGAEVQQPLAVAVIGGLLSSTVLTLGVVPAVYKLLARKDPIREPSVNAAEAHP
jgi:hydrophobic/amphiphilic exporter-1 (mainly G- bacteria), HAE1 family